MPSVPPKRDATDGCRSVAPHRNQAAMETWASMAAGEACRALVDRRRSAGEAWPYTRYAVAEIGASGYLMLRWDAPSTRADCPA